MAKKTIKSENKKSLHFIAGDYKELKEVNTKYLYKYYRNNKGTLSYDLFKEIVSLFNQRLSERINRGYGFKMPYNLFKLEAVRATRLIKKSKKSGKLLLAVNWGESNKIKAEILSRGGFLYEEYQDEQGVKIGDNGGEEWLVYHTDGSFYHWLGIGDLTLHNSSWYVFETTWSNQRNLIASIDEDAELLFPRYSGKPSESRIKFKALITKVKVAEQSFDLCSQ